eukprot:5398139-Pleurochrysis_carterae.AAC.3
MNLCRQPVSAPPFAAKISLPAVVPTRPRWLCVSALPCLNLNLSLVDLGPPGILTLRGAYPRSLSACRPPPSSSHPPCLCRSRSRSLSFCSLGCSFSLPTDYALHRRPTKEHNV